MDGCGSLKKCSGVKEWLEQNALYENEDTVPNGRVKSSQYIYVRKSDNKIIGMFQIRYYLNEYLAKYGGNIGYSIRPSERRKGYAKMMLNEGLKLCKEAKMKKVLITCLEENEGSRKTILANGGKFDGKILEPNENVILERYWIDLK
jgi:predicted acetyltransferase